MFKKRHPDDAEKNQIFGMHVGDLGIIAIAALITLAFLGILLSPSPFPKLEAMQAKAEKAEADAQLQAYKEARRKEIARSVATGEVSVGIPPPKP